MFNVKKGVGFKTYFKLVDSADFATPENGVGSGTVTGAYSKNGGAATDINLAAASWLVLSGSVSGLYSFSVPAAAVDTIGELMVAVIDDGAGIAGAARVYNVVSHPVDDLWQMGRIITTFCDNIVTDTNQIQGKLPTNNIMGSSDKTDKDDEIDAIKAVTDGLAAADIADAVWDELSTGHTDAGKAGRKQWWKVSQIQASIANVKTSVAQARVEIAALNDPTAGAIADAVWNELSTGHTDAGKAGKMVFDKISAIVGDIDGLNDPTAGAVADAVWDELSTGHTDAGKAGRKQWWKVSQIQASIANVKTSVAQARTEIGTLDARVKGVSNAVINNIDPSINGISNLVANEIEPSVNGISNIVNNELEPSVNAISTVVKGISNAVINNIDPSVNGISNLIANQIEPSVNKMSTAIEGISTSIEGISNLVVNAIDPSINGISNVVANEIEPSTDIISNYVKNNIDPSVNGISNLIANQIEPSVNKMSTAIEGISTSIEGISNAVINNIDPSVNAISNAVINNMDPSINGISNIVANELEPSMNKISTAIEGMSTSVEGISNVVKNVGVAFHVSSISHASSHLLHQDHVTIGQTGDFSTVAGSLRLARAQAIGDWTVAADALDVMDIDGTSQKSLTLIPGGGPYTARA